MTGPLHDTRVVCLTCYKPLKAENVSICDNCGLPFCSTICQQDEIHKSQECALFVERGLQFSCYFKPHFQEDHPIYQVCTYYNMLEVILFRVCIYVLHV